MIPDKICDAIFEAKRFIEKAKLAMKQAEDADVPLDPSREAGACRRASMDLTRALAEMRRTR